MRTSKAHPFTLALVTLLGLTRSPITTPGASAQIECGTTTGCTMGRLGQSCTAECQKLQNCTREFAQCPDKSPIVVGMCVNPGNVRAVVCSCTKQQPPNCGKKGKIQE